MCVFTVGLVTLHKTRELELLLLEVTMCYLTILLKSFSAFVLMFPAASVAPMGVFNVPPPSRFICFEDPSDWMVFLI